MCNYAGSSMRALVALAIVWYAAGAAVAAGVTSVNVWPNEEYQQPGLNAPTIPYAYFFAMGGSFRHRHDYNKVLVRYPGPGSPQVMTISGKNFSYESSNVAPALRFKMDYPLGNYVIMAANSLTGRTSVVTIALKAYHFTKEIPALTPASYTALHELDPAAAFTVHFNSFKPSATASGSTWFTISNLRGSTVFSRGGLSPGTTSVVIPANTLLPNFRYRFLLDFSDRLTSQQVGGDASILQGFDNRTTGLFSTGPAKPPVPLAPPPPNPVHQAILAALARYKTNVKRATVDYRAAAMRADWREVHLLVGALHGALGDGNARELARIAKRLNDAAGRLGRDAGTTSAPAAGGHATSRPSRNKNPLVRAAVTRYQLDMKSALAAYHAAALRADELEQSMFMAAQRKAMSDFNAQQVVLIDRELGTIGKRLEKAVHSAPLPPVPPLRRQKGATP
ncbi:MAG: hypothetical protein ACYCUV_14665 [Phycisphaerae bacterium]